MKFRPAVGTSDDEYALIANFQWKIKSS